MHTRVLIVEDQLLIAEELRHRLEGLGHVVIGVARTGPEALQLTEAEAVDLVMVDVNLPGPWDGIETAGRLSPDRRGAIVYVTAYADDDILRRAKATEPAAYLLKPFTGDIIRVTVEIALHNQRLRRERAAAVAEQQAGARLQSIGQLSGAIAHDFNNLLTVVLGAARLLPTASPSEVVELAEQLEEVGLRGSALTRHLLAQLRRQTPPEPRPIDLGAAVHALTPLLGRLVGPVVDLAVRASEGMWIELAPGHLDQILMNLVANARAALPGGGRIQVCVEHDATGEVRLRVADDGVGMDAETLARCTEPYFSTRADGDGTGIGLATVARLARESGARLDIDSALGRGTRVALTFPACPPATGGATADEGPRARAEGLVLVVEDDGEVRNVVRVTLEREGYTVVAVSDAVAALAFADLSAPAPDVVLLDVVLPGMSGVHLAALLEQRWPEARFRFSAGDPTAPALRELTPAQHGALLWKPFTGGELLEAVQLPRTAMTSST